MNTIKQWQAAIAKDLLDFDVRLIFADWLEEQGKLKEANFQRWMAKERVRVFWHGSTMRSCWWLPDTNKDYPTGPSHGDIPLIYFKELDNPCSRYACQYASRLLAEKDLFAAWKIVRKREKEEALRNAYTPE